MNDWDTDVSHDANIPILRFDSSDDLGVGRDLAPAEVDLVVGRRANGQFRQSPSQDLVGIHRLESSRGTRGSQCRVVFDGDDQIPNCNRSGVAHEELHGRRGTDSDRVRTGAWPHFEFDLGYALGARHCADRRCRSCKDLVGGPGGGFDGQFAFALGEKLSR